ncbi:MAG: hypothetical protein ABJV68_23440 [Paracoccaceae bacterium]
MLELDELKNWLHRDISRSDKLLLILSTSDEQVSISDLKQRAASTGFRVPTKWNLSQILKSSGEKAVRGTNGWELTESGKMHLRTLGVSKISPAALQVAVDLRAHLAAISDEQSKSFVEEAISCHEAELWRSAVVMSWLGAMDVLHKHVHAQHLCAFNVEATKVLGKRWKIAKSTDDLGRMGESDFLDRIAALSIIGKNVKTELKGCLDRRNGCGHPNTYKIGVNQSAAHIESLLLNVFHKFS